MSETMMATPTPMSTTTPSMLATGAPPAYEADGAAASNTDMNMMMQNMNMMMRGRDKLPWSTETWQRLDCAIHDECKRTRVAAQFLPIIKVPECTTTVSTDAFTQDEATQSLVVDEGAYTRLIEFWVEFSLTPQQVEQEALMQPGGGPNMAQPNVNGYCGQSTALTLATRAANRLSQAEDRILFQGRRAFTSRFFHTNHIRHRGLPTDYGLLDIPSEPESPTPPPPVEVIHVKPDPSDEFGAYGTNTFKAVAEGYAALEDKGHYGPYALTLHTVPYADTFAPLRSDALAITADRIKPLMTAPLMTPKFFGSGTLIAGGDGKTTPKFTGSLVSVGGNTMDLVCGYDATVTCQQEDVDGNSRLRVAERLALRIKDYTAIIRLEFD
jgi:uncharacterized linocin/CFP29 family protein